VSDSYHRAFRLLPSERVLWHGKPRLDVPREGYWSWVPALALSLSLVVALFAGLLHVAGIPAVRSTALLACYLATAGLAVALAPRYLLDACEYLVTDRHVIWKRGSLRRVLDRRAITYARIHWHPSEPGVGDLELLRAAPFGPLLRKERLVLHHVQAPDRLLSLINEQTPSEFAGYADVQLTDRLDEGEYVIWGAAPLGYRLGRAEVQLAVLGVMVLGSAGLYLHRTLGVLSTLETLGLPVRSATWVMFFLAVAISGVIMCATGALLLYHGVWGARAEGSSTEYVLTNRRVIIRRGRTELSVDRRRIVDVAEQPSTGDLGNLYLILDGPAARALDDSGALGHFAPPRAQVLPVLYEVADREHFRHLLLGPAEEAKPAPKPPERDAA
jgi:hypothetical protein